MFRSVLGQIPQLYHGGIAPTATSSEVGASLADLTGATPLSPRHATDLLAPVAGTRIIIMLDEFDRATSRSFRRSIAELRSEEHTSELQSLMRISSAVFCL